MQHLFTGWHRHRRRHLQLDCGTASRTACLVSACAVCQALPEFKGLPVGPVVL